MLELELELELELGLELGLGLGPAHKVGPLRVQGSVAVAEPEPEAVAEVGPVVGPGVRLGLVMGPAEAHEGTGR